MNTLSFSAAKNMTDALKLQRDAAATASDQAPEVQAAYATIAEAIAKTDGSTESLISTMTGFSPEELDRLGGL